MADKEVNIAMELMRTFHMFKKIQMHPTKQGPKLMRSEQMIIMNLSKHQNNEQLKISDFSKMLELAPSTISPIIHSMEKAGYIERCQDSEDRRVVYIKLTQAGAKVAADMKLEFKRVIQSLAEYLGQEDTEKLIELLHKMFEFMQESEKKQQAESEENAE